MIKQSLCQERRDFGIPRKFFSDITQTVRIVYIFFSIFYYLFSFYHDFCAGSMIFSQLYVVFMSIFFHVQILFNFIFAVKAKKTQLCDCALSGPITLHVFFCFYRFLFICKNQLCFISTLITVPLSWQLHLQRDLPVQKS